jgi:hypothetical protein
MHMQASWRTPSEKNAAATAAGAAAAGATSVVSRVWRFNMTGTADSSRIGCRAIPHPLSAAVRAGVRGLGCKLLHQSPLE